MNCLGHICLKQKTSTNLLGQADRFTANKNRYMTDNQCDRSPILFWRQKIIFAKIE